MGAGFRADAEALVNGLRELRAQGLLCDVALTDGKRNGEATPHLAHQAVLAAASRPLRNYFVSHKEVDAHLPSAPRLQELRLNGLSTADEAVNVALGHIYGGSQNAPTEAALEDAIKLKCAFGLRDLKQDAESLVAGLNDLRAEAALCDIVLLAAGQRFPAHQAVLATAGGQLRECVLNRAQQLASDAYGNAKEAMGVASKNMELELPGINHAEALSAMLDHIYANPKADTTQQPSSEVAWDIAKLAQSLGLAKLRQQTSEWLADEFMHGIAEDATMGMEEDAMEPAEEPEQKLTQDKQPEQQEQLEQQPEEMEDATSHPELPSLWERALAATQCCRHAETKKVPAKSTVPADVREELSKREEARLEKLRALFDERPVWLEQALQDKLPSTFTEELLQRLLPFVAYQWVDGPWQSAYVRFGWDPRKNADEAKMLQVLLFRDPYFASMSKKAQDFKDAPTSDCHFRQPPTRPQQTYQLVDIKDDFVSSLVVSAETVKPSALSKATGWLTEEVVFAVREALGVRSQRLRDRQIALRRNSVARGKASSRPSSGRSGAGVRKVGKKGGRTGRQSK